MDIALTVGGSFLSGFLQVLFDRMATPEFLTLFRERKHDDEILKKLKTNLLVIRAVLDDAENKQSRNQAVKEWLDELQETLYQTDDFLDQINTEALRVKVETEYQMTTNQVSSHTYTSLLSNAFFKEMMPGIGEMVVRLEGFIQHISPLGLQVGEVKKQHPFRLPSTCLVGESTVYGRDTDKKKIIEMLLSEVSNGENISVLPIVGLGGIGKTTLAQLIYNDEKVKAHFDIQGWVCISEEYDAIRITKDLLRELNISSLDSSENFNALQVNLHLGLAEKRFLLVLDDVWNRDYNDWDKLIIPLRGGLKGSKIIVTTRDENIALMMSNGPIYHLQLIAEDDCWSLFEKHALGNRDGNGNPELAQIGKKIVKKCEGLPLAVKTVAGLLRSKTTVEDWEGILRSDVWNQSTNQNGILPALRLSYIHLPSHLKRCFIYCAVFHKGYNFRKEDVIQLWLANDLLGHPWESKRIEDVGVEYFHELRLRSLFQQSFDNLFSMHDLVNDMARFLRGKYCMRLEDRPQRDGAIVGVRDFSYLVDYFDSFKKLQLLRMAKNLRTFLPLRKNVKGGCRASRLSKKLLHDMLPSFKSLRVLSLSGYRIPKLPDSIGNLKQLRLLDLSLTNIQILPDWICTLYNLQTLLLSNCVKLEELPVDLGKLINLRYLDIRGTQLKKMLIQIGKLRSLQVLTASVVGKDSGSTIGELGKFPNLRDNLIISGLENVVNGKDALMANIKAKKHLERLSLKWRGDTNDSQVARDVLDNLQPHSSLKHLEIDGYCGTRFPDWLGKPSFCHIVSISLSNCNHCFCLPALGQLVSLKMLRISRMSKLLEVDKEIYGVDCVTKPFPSLKILKFEKMPEWRHWYIPQSEVFSCLEELYVISCPKLIGEFPKQLLSLQKFEISGCNQLLLLDGHLSIFNALEGGLVQQLPFLHKLVLSSMENMKDLSLELNQLTSQTWK
ncbi:hypothetical protein ACH5RR_000990 [Cinchona calisaya]|uniref:Disease resistance RPP13-like protein 1 n=1 Tax=Cinchona calisaya TaxID=153742 RepID=A0ABD3B2D0_9GENT